MVKDKIIVITGASGGLGKELSSLLSAKGAKVVVSSRDKNKLEKTAKETSSFPVVADVASQPDVENLARETVKKFGRIDYWINNAGIWLPRCPVEDLDMKRVHQMMEVNLFGTMYGSQEALRQMKKQGRGVIVNIISTSALEGRPKSAGYAASKRAVMGFTESLRAELKGKDIKVIAVYPGGMKTNLFDEGKPDDFEDYMDVASVAKKIVDNMELAEPHEDQIIKREVNK